MCRSRQHSMTTGRATSSGGGDDDDDDDDDTTSGGWARWAGAGWTRRVLRPRGIPMPRALGLRVGGNQRQECGSGPTEERSRGSSWPRHKGAEKKEERALEEIVFVLGRVHQPRHDPAAGRMPWPQHQLWTASPAVVNTILLAPELPTYARTPGWPVSNAKQLPRLIYLSRRILAATSTLYPPAPSTYAGLGRLLLQISSQAFR
ncbi:hypothetical protein CDD83_9039 [Cordyceps sp. RAO-2017]|nr:hypothetical protein CDD83_9039 [Cordyceps sp. RAO-2017]